MCLSITVTTKKFRCLKLAYISEVILMDCHKDVRAAKSMVTRALDRKRQRDEAPENHCTESPNKRFKDLGGGKIFLF